MSTVVPTGGNVTPSLLLGWGRAVCLGLALEEVAFAFAVDLGDEDEDEDEDDPVLAIDEAVPWAAVPWAAVPWAAVPWAAVPVVEVELDDPPHAVSSSTSELSPVATVHPLLRITSLSLREDPGTGSLRIGLALRRRS
jgi:hypothetical protein